MYSKQEWNNGTRLDAFRLNHIEDGIYECSKEINSLKNNEKSTEDFALNVDFSEFKKQVEEFFEKYKEDIEKQKKEITALKTKVTKLSKKDGDK